MGARAAGQVLQAHVQVGLSMGPLLQGKGGAPLGAGGQGQGAASWRHVGHAAARQVGGAGGQHPHRIVLRGARICAGV